MKFDRMAFRRTLKRLIVRIRYLTAMAMEAGGAFILEDSVLKELIDKAQQGDECSRQELIQGNKIFMQRLATKICKRVVSWNDDEMSISLIAFNEAIDRYQESQNDRFYTYAKVVIQSRLIDYFRKEGRRQTDLSLDVSPLDPEGGNEFHSAEIRQSWHHYNEQNLIRDRVEEIRVYSIRLAEYGIVFEELEEASPDRKDARKTLVGIAHEFVKYPHLIEFLTKAKQLPIKQLLDFAQVSRKTVERGRKYLIALIVILVSDDLPHLKSTIVFPDLERRES